MVICKFFLQGECRFGESCRFEHQMNSEKTGNHQFVNSKIINPKTGNEVELGTLLNAVQNDAISAEKSKVWLLSYYAPFKDKALYPGFIDLSFEEVRFGYLEAQKSNTLEQYNRNLQQTIVEAKARYKALEKPTLEIIELLKNIYTNEFTSNSLSNQSFHANNTINIGPSSNTSMFGQKSPVFGQQNSFGGGSSIFGQQNNPQNNVSSFAQPGGSIFGRPNAPLGTGTVFGQQSGSIFQQKNAILNDGGVFNQPQSKSSIFGQKNASLFGPPSTGSSVFGQQNNSIFNQQNVASSSIFGKTNSSQASGSIFGQQNNTPTSSNIFMKQNNTQPVSNVFGHQNNAQTGSNVFGQQNNAQTGSSIFGQQSSTQNTISPFGKPNTNSIFGRQNTNSIFGQQNAAQSSGNIFGQQNGSQSGSNLFVQQTPPKNTNSFFGNLHNAQQTTPQKTSSIFGQQNTVQTGGNIFAQQNSLQSSGSVFSQQGSVVNASGSIFGQNNANKGATDLKTQIDNSQQNTSFGNQNKNLFNTHPQGGFFGPQVHEQDSVPANNRAGTIFSRNSDQTGFFANQNSNSPHQARNNNPALSIFGLKPNSTPGGASISGPHGRREFFSDAYSKLEDLSEEEIKWFNSDVFDINTIPLKPPTFEMCF